MASNDRTELTTETWAAFLQSVAYAVSSLDTQPADSTELLRRAAFYLETHPMPDKTQQDDVRATLAFLARIVRNSSGSD